ncbi:MAG TPA: sodium:solute symporter family protein [Ignavibacteria bacterium]|nr:sodium:solute symporter family protein [Ignavibacteria bacterium]
MVSFSSLDIIVVVTFFFIVLTIGFFTGRKTSSDANDYLLFGRNVGLFLFVLTNVSTWYGGILGVGEFTYRYGLLSWFTQGFPYYIFAFLFAIFFAKKIHKASLFTIPDKISELYGKKAGLFSAVLVFVLVSPAPYFLMIASLISLIFNINLFISLLIALLLSVSYLFKGGFRSNVYTDAFQFFVMFAGFILILLSAYSSLGGFNYLTTNLPKEYLHVSGGASPSYILVWFFIALWTFADPGFHQRCYSAKSGKVAMKGILISILFWALFDFLTTSTGLYAKALLPDLTNPVLSFPLLAERILSPGIKGIFYAGLFATILSTSNSFLFLSGTTIARDFIFRLDKKQDESLLKKYTFIGLIISGIIALVLAYFIPSVIDIWYLLGSFSVPGIILPVVSAYYPKIKIRGKFILYEMILSVGVSILWYLIRGEFANVYFLKDVEPLLAGLFVSIVFHSFFLFMKIEESNTK